MNYRQTYLCGEKLRKIFFQWFMIITMKSGELNRKCPIFLKLTVFAIIYSIIIIGTIKWVQLFAYDCVFLLNNYKKLLRTWKKFFGGIFLIVGYKFLIMEHFKSLSIYSNSRNKFNNKSVDLSYLFSLDMTYGEWEDILLNEA